MAPFTTQESKRKERGFGDVGNPMRPRVASVGINTQIIPHPSTTEHRWRGAPLILVGDVSYTRQASVRPVPLYPILYNAGPHGGLASFGHEE